jgi:hypothetical protein
MSQPLLKRAVDKSQTIVKLSSDIMQSCQKYIAIFAAIIVITIVLFYAKSDSSAATTMTTTYTIAIIVPLLMTFLYIQNIPPFGGDVKSSIAFYGFMGLVLTSFMIYYFYTKILPASALVLVNGIIYVILFFIIILAMMIFYNVFINSIKRMETGKYGLFIQFIFYIPCFITEVISYLVGEYKSTPTIVFVFFIIEIMLVLLYIYAPYLIRRAASLNGSMILNKPVFLDSETFIVSSDDLKTSTSNTDIPLQSVGSGENLLSQNTTNTSNDFLSQSSASRDVYIAPEFRYLKNYSISMWIFINTQPSSSQAYSKETVIFNYGHKTREGISCSKPKLTYNQIDNAYYVYSTDDDKHGDYSQNRYKIDILTLPNQRWNNFVFNYTDNSADLFINGRLERSFSLSSRLPTYTVDDTISVGERNGLFGAICNIQFHTKNMKKGEITNNYNVYRLLNPPIEDNT